MLSRLNDEEQRELYDNLKFVKRELPKFGQSLQAQARGTSFSWMQVLTAVLASAVVGIGSSYLTLRWNQSALIARVAHNEESIRETRHDVHENRKWREDHIYQWHRTAR